MRLWIFLATVPIAACSGYSPFHGGPCREGNFAGNAQSRLGDAVMQVQEIRSRGEPYPTYGELPEPGLVAGYIPWDADTSEPATASVLDGLLEALGMRLDVGQLRECTEVAGFVRTLNENDLEAIAGLTSIGFSESTTRATELANSPRYADSEYPYEEPGPDFIFVREPAAPGSGEFASSGEEFCDWQGLSTDMEYGLSLGPDVTSLDRLGNLTRLSALDLNRRHQPNLQSIAGLAELKEIATIQICGYPQLDGLEALTQLDRLTNLVLVGTGITAVPPLTSSAWAESGNFISLHNPSLDLTNLAGLGPHMREVALTRSGQVRDLSFLSATEHIQRLVLIDLPNLTSLEGIGPKIRITELELTDIPLASMAGMEETDGLDYLTLEDLPQLTNLEALDGLIVNHARLRNLPMLTSLQGLRAPRQRNDFPIAELYNLPGLPACDALNWLRQVNPSPNASDAPSAWGTQVDECYESLVKEFHPVPWFDGGTVSSTSYPDGRPPTFAGVATGSYAGGVIELSWAEAWDETLEMPYDECKNQVQSSFDFKPCVVEYYVYDAPTADGHDFSAGHHGRCTTLDLEGDGCTLVDGTFTWTSGAGQTSGTHHLIVIAQDVFGNRAGQGQKVTVSVP